MTNLLLLLLLSHVSRVRLSATPWTAAYQAPLYMAFSRQEYWSWLPCPSPRDLPNPGMEPVSYVSSPALVGGFLTLGPPGETPVSQINQRKGVVEILKAVL